jgi:hypothetical protein
MNIELNLKINVSIPEDRRIGIENLTNSIAGLELNKLVTKSIIEECQELLVKDLCGPKHQRKEERRYRRAGKKRRTIGTRFGRLKLKLRRVKDEKGRVFKLVYELLEFDGKKQYQKDISFIGIDLATKLTYRDCKKEAELFVKELSSPRTICRRVHEVLPLLESEEREEKENQEYELLYADGTKAHGIGKDNELRVALALEKGKKKLLCCRVNKSWEEIQEQIAGELADDFSIIADGEKGLQVLLKDKEKSRYQLCLDHAVRYTNCSLWKDGIGKKQRRKIVGRVASILFTLKNSVLKHLKDKEHLKQRVDWAVEELKKLYGVVKEFSWSTAKFLRKVSNHSVTFARICYQKGKLIPWNNNLIERLMGELSKRIKHK